MNIMLFIVSEREKRRRRLILLDKCALRVVQTITAELVGFLLSYALMNAFVNVVHLSSKILCNNLFFEFDTNKFIYFSFNAESCVFMLKKNNSFRLCY